MKFKTYWVLLITMLVLPGCASYTTPAAGVAIPALTQSSIADKLARQPAASLPARMAVARIQAGGYRPLQGDCFGEGAFCVITVRDVEQEDDFKRLAALPEISGLATLSRLLLPAKLDGLDALREAAATLKTDLLLVYTIDTRFYVDGAALGPLSILSLGLLPTEQASVTATASAVLLDVRTGFVFGVAESSAQQQKRSNSWGSNDAINSSRKLAERESFTGLLSELEKQWPTIVGQLGSAQKYGGFEK